MKRIWYALKPVVLGIAVIAYAAGGVAINLRYFPPEGDPVIWLIQMIGTAAAIAGVWITVDRFRKYIDKRR